MRLPLRGGLARRLAPPGVLNVLAENQIPIDAVAGTSVGTIIAAGYAGGCSNDEMLAEARRVCWKDFPCWTVHRLGLASNERVEAMLGRQLRCRTFEALRIPLAVVAADLATGEAVIFRRGELIPPLRASCSFLGLFAPIEYQGRGLVDGTIVSSLPVTALRDLGVNLVIAVDVKLNGPRHVPTNLFQVIGEAFQIAQSQNQNNWRQQCDAVIEPHPSDFAWDAFDPADELISIGERAARAALPSPGARLESSRQQEAKGLRHAAFRET